MATKSYCAEFHIEACKFTFSRPKIVFVENYSLTKIMSQIESHDRALYLQFSVRSKRSWCVLLPGVPSCFSIRAVITGGRMIIMPVADLRGARGTGPKFFQFHAVFGKIWQNRMLAPPGSWRPLLGEILDLPLYAIESRGKHGDENIPSLSRSSNDSCTCMLN